MHVGFKVQLVVEFYFYLSFVSRSVRHEAIAKTPERACVKPSREQRPPSLAPISKVHSAPGLQFLSLYLEDGVQKLLGGY